MKEKKCNIKDDLLEFPLSFFILVLPILN